MHALSDSLTPKRSLVAVMMSGFVLFTILGAARALFSVETPVFRFVLVGWIAFGAAPL